MSRSVLVTGTPTSIGSLPHTDPAAAAAFVLTLHSDLPAAPQLPNRSPYERMLAQAACGVIGVEVESDGSLTVDGRAIDPDAPVEVDFGESWAGLVAFVDAIAGRADAVKLQTTGPVTLGLALLKRGAPADRAFAVAQVAVEARARALVELVRDRAPNAPLLLFLDEPGLAVCHRPAFPLDPGQTVDLLASGLRAFGDGVTTGLHCCGPADWRVAFLARPDVLSVPLDVGLDEHAPAFRSFLDDGGWVAWGIVPTDRPVGDDPDPLWARLAAAWEAFGRLGCDRERLAEQALVTPACGLARHAVAQAERALTLTANVGDRVRARDGGGASRRHA